MFRIKGETLRGSWLIRGQVRKAIRIETSIVAYGRLSVASQPLQHKSIGITAMVPLQSLTVTSSSPKVNAWVFQNPTNPTRYHLEIEPAARLPQGSFDCVVNLVSLPSGADRPATTQVHVSGDLTRDVQVSPFRVAFGASEFGREVQETVTLYSLSSKEVELLGLKVEGAGMSAERGHRETIGNPTLVVKQRITQVGEQNGRLLVQVRTQDGSTEELVIPVSYRGLSR